MRCQLLHTRNTDKPCQFQCQAMIQEYQEDNHHKGQRCRRRPWTTLTYHPSRRDHHPYRSQMDHQWRSNQVNQHRMLKYQWDPTIPRSTYQPSPQPQYLLLMPRSYGMEDAPSEAELA